MKFTSKNRCTWFDNSSLKTGKALCLPATDPLTTYPVHVEGGDIFIDLPEAQP